MNLDKKQLEETILKTISDSIIFSRITTGVNSMLSTVNNSKTNSFELEYQYHGLGIAFDLLGISNEFEDDELKSSLTDVFDQMMKIGMSENAFDLSKSIYIEWLIMISTFNNSKRLN